MLKDVVYLEMPVDRETKAEWHKKGFKVLPLEMKPEEEKEKEPTKRTRKPKEE